MKKLLKFVTLAIAAALLLALAACGGNNQPTGETATPTPTATPPAVGADTNETTEPTERERTYLTVLTWDRGGDGHRDSADNFFTRWIAEQVLEELNMVVTFEAIGRWDEDEVIPLMFAGGTMPDLAMTWNGGLVSTFGRQGGILNLEPLLNEHLPRLPYLNSWVDNLLWQNQDPLSGEVFSIMQRRASSGLARTGTFIRSDWLETLGLPIPTTHEEFIDTLKAFRDNADVLGVSNMVPLAMTQDVRWRASTLLESLIDPFLTDEERFIYSVGDRHILFPGYVDGVRMLNYMFNEGLLFSDFPLHDTDEATDNLTIAGQVGAYIHNWDNLWRSTPDIMNRLNEVDPNARFIPIDPFPNPQTGLTQKNTYAAHGFHVFIPASSRNPVGALEYLDWMSRLENRLFLQTGIEGIHHNIVNLEGYELPILFSTDSDGPHRMYSPNNVDLTLVVGSPPDFGSNRANALAASLGFPGIDPELVVQSMEIALLNGRQAPIFQIPGGMPFNDEFSATFQTLASNALVAAITAPVDQFDAVWQAQMDSLMAAGAAQAMDERRDGLRRITEQAGD